MLKSRVLTSIILVPIVLCGIYLLPVHWYALFFALIAIGGSREWARMSGGGVVVQIGFMLVTAAVLLALYHFGEFAHYVVMLGALWWLVALGLVQAFPKSKIAFNSLFLNLIVGLLIVVPMWQAMVLLKTHDLANLMITLLLLLIWGADTGAYFAGRAFGNRKLAPNVSPGKTWAGVYGALGVATVIALAAGVYLDSQLNWSLVTWLMWFVIILVTVSLSIVGDLTESMLKRIYGIKDSGRLLPGHGGIMDRIDSMCAAAPVFVAGLILSSML